ncbi:ribosomal protein S18 [Xylariaceae sp. FL0016]|nr:ribosomal protein S18 [Xylariaceae sp. FL0016]
MPPRLPISLSLRQPSAWLKAPAAHLSSTTPARLRNDLPTTSSSASSSILSLDSSSSSSQPASHDATSGARDIFDSMSKRPRGGAGGPESRGRLEDQLQSNSRNTDYTRQLPRKWKVGDVYAPHDLSPQEMAKFRRNTRRQMDLVDMLGLHPADMYRNFSFISEFITPYGRIKKCAETGLRPPNQRKVAKAIRRAIGLGIHPSVHKHPELLSTQVDRRSSQNQATTNKGL